MGRKDPRWTSLHRAAKKNDPRAATEALQCGADINAQDSNGETPLHIAMRKGFIDVVTLLRKEGASVEIKDKKGVKPAYLAPQMERAMGLSLLKAAEDGHLEKAELLLSKGAPVNTQNQYGTSPLLAAAQKGDEAMVELLLKNNANVFAEKPKKHRPETPLDYEIVRQSQRVRMVPCPHQDRKGNFDTDGLGCCSLCHTRLWESADFQWAYYHPGEGMVEERMKVLSRDCRYEFVGIHVSGLPTKEEALQLPYDEFFKLIKLVKEREKPLDRTGGISCRLTSKVGYGRHPLREELDWVDKAPITIPLGTINALIEKIEAEMPS